MGNFSKSPLDVCNENREKGYTGLHIEQGVPVLDRDLNLLQDLISGTLRAVISRYIGNGVAAGDTGFAIESIPADNDLSIAGPGTCLVGGIEVAIADTMLYSDQDGVPALTTPIDAEPDPRRDTVYLDVWLSEVDGTVDEGLLNAADVGMQTSVRLRPAWVVRVAENGAPPAPGSGHVHYPLALLERPRGIAAVEAGMITDSRHSILRLADIEKRLARLEALTILPAFNPSPQFDPLEGAPRTPVRIFGRNFAVGFGTPTVLFGGVTATVNSFSDTQIDALVLAPADEPGPVHITVTTEYGTAVSSEEFDLLQDVPQPIITGFNPTSGGPEDSVVLSGSNFGTDTLTVRFGSKPAEVTSSNDTSISVKVPHGEPGPVRITVTTADGGTAESRGTFELLLDKDVTFFKSLSPPSGGPGMRVQLFVKVQPKNWPNLDDAIVRFGTEERVIESYEANIGRFWVRVPDMPPGPVEITVSHPAAVGGNSYKSDGTFEVEQGDIDS